jgi:DNA-binding transcriptional ArsR family regulator
MLSIDQRPLPGAGLELSSRRPPLCHSQRGKARANNAWAKSQPPERRRPLVARTRSDQTGPGGCSFSSQACDTSDPTRSLVAGSARAARRNPGDRPGRYSAPIGALHATLDRTFFALSDPTRRGILERLGRGPATIGELAEPFGLTINGVKKHVGILEEVDLVVTAKVGRARECQLGPAQLEDATEWIDDYRRTWQRRLDRFGTYVERTNAGR